MRQTITIRLNPSILDAAKTKAAADNRSLTNYIETLMRRDLQLNTTEPALEVIAPTDIRNFTPLARPGETDEERQYRHDVISAILDSAGY